MHASSIVAVLDAKTCSMSAAPWSEAACAGTAVVMLMIALRIVWG